MGSGTIRSIPETTQIERLIPDGSLAEEDRAFMSVCEPEADDFDNAMTLSVCNEIDGCAGHVIAPDDLTPDKGLETIPPGLGCSTSVSLQMSAQSTNSAAVNLVRSEYSAPCLARLFGFQVIRV